jgi:hypothetical protein
MPVKARTSVRVFAGMLSLIVSMDYVRTLGQFMLHFMNQDKSRLMNRVCYAQSKHRGNGVLGNAHSRCDLAGRYIAVGVGARQEVLSKVNSLTVRHLCNLQKRLSPEHQ